MNIKDKQMINVSREIETLKNSISRIYKHISQMKNLLDWLNKKLETVKNRSLNLKTDHKNYPIRKM